VVLGQVLVIVGTLASPTPGVVPDSHSPIFTCKGEVLPPPIEALLRPVLLPMAAARRARRDHDKTYVNAFEALIESSDKNALEAQVALMAYYVGEHYGEELLSSVLGRARRADKLVERYAACRPPVSFEKELEGVIVLKTLYTQYREQRK
jgi:hypothetical protein